MSGSLRYTICFLALWDKHYTLYICPCLSETNTICFPALWDKHYIHVQMYMPVALWDKYYIYACGSLRQTLYASRLSETNTIYMPPALWDKHYIYALGSPRQTLYMYASRLSQTWCIQIKSIKQLICDGLRAVSFVVCYLYDNWWVFFSDSCTLPFMCPFWSH